MCRRPTSCSFPPAARMPHCTRCDAALGSGRARPVLDAARHLVRHPGRPRTSPTRWRVAGPPEIVFVGGSMATTLAWEDPATAKGFRRLASFARARRPTTSGVPGASDRFNRLDAPTLADLVRDLAAVIDAAGVTDPVLFGTHNGGAVAALYAALYPVRQLVLCNTWARLRTGRRLPDRFSDRGPRPSRGALPRPSGGRGASRQRVRAALRRRGPGRSSSARPASNQLVDHLPRSTGPTTSVPSCRRSSVPDTRHPPGGKREHPAGPRPLHRAGAIPVARLVLLPGTDQVFLRNYAKPVIDEVERFVTGDLIAVHRPRPGHHSVHRHRRLHAARPPRWATRPGVR